MIIPAFTAAENNPPAADERILIETLSDYYDPENGGFGNGSEISASLNTVVSSLSPGR